MTTMLTEVQPDVNIIIPAHAEVANELTVVIANVVKPVDQAKGWHRSAYVER